MNVSRVDRGALRGDADRLVARAASLLAYRRWQAALNAGRGLRPARIVVYHSFSPGGWGYTAPAELRRHLDVLSETYEIVGLPRLVHALRTRAATGTYVALTVDDAYEDFFNVAYPILNERRIPATIFVPTGYIGMRNEWEERPHTELPIMSGAQLRELDPALITIGSHSVHHKVLTALGNDAARMEVRNSKDALEDILGRAVTLFAYPFGHLSTYTPTTFEALRGAGYDAAVSTRWGTFASPDELFELRRIDFQGARTRDDIIGRLAGDWDWRAGRELAAHALRSAARAVNVRGRRH